jgi:trimethylamine--corrinoid protein Co-methyltransferase
MSLPTTLSWPDIIVGAGMLDGSMVSSLEKILIDVEIFKLAKHAHRGIDTEDGNWLTDVIEKVGPGGHYLCEMSTTKALRSGEWYISDFGAHVTYDEWNDAGRKDIPEEAGEKVDQILATHEVLPLGDDVEKELAKICKRAKEAS